MKLFAALLLPLLAGAAILPDSIGAYHRTAVSQPTLNGRDLWDEYGLHEYESATYEKGAAKFTATAYQLQDPAGGQAAARRGLCRRDRRRTDAGSRELSALVRRLQA